MAVSPKTFANVLRLDCVKGGIIAILPESHIADKFVYDECGIQLITDKSKVLKSSKVHHL